MTTMVEAHEPESQERATLRADTPEPRPAPFVQPPLFADVLLEVDSAERGRRRSGLSGRETNWEHKMDREHTYRVTAWWASGQTGITKSDSAPNAVHFAAPPQFGGMEGRWTPEDLLLSAIASCFTTTFQAVAAYSKFEYLDLEVEVEGTVSKTISGYCFTGILIRPSLTIPYEDGQTRALELLKKAKALCLVSRALATAQEFIPHVEIGKMAPVG